MFWIFEQLANDNSIYFFFTNNIWYRFTVVNNLFNFFFSFHVGLHVTRSSLVQFGHKHRLKTLQQQQLQLTQGNKRRKCVGNYNLVHLFKHSLFLRDSKMPDSVNLYKYFVFSPKYLAYILFNHLLIQICNYHDIHQLRFAFAFRMHYFSFLFLLPFSVGLSIRWH